jgi:hypothetical protein
VRLLAPGDRHRVAHDLSVSCVRFESTAPLTIRSTACGSTSGYGRIPPITKGPIVYALQKYDFFVLFPINPSTSAKYPEAFKPSRAKDDPTDAEFALDLLMRHPERFTALQAQSQDMHTLLSLTEHRRELVADKTRFTVRLTNTLKQYYPQAPDWFDQRDTVLFCDFLTRWPTLTQVKRARPASLKAFFYAHNGRRART